MELKCYNTIRRSYIFTKKYSTSDSFMKKAPIKNIITWLAKASIAGILAIAILSAVAFFYNFTGIHITNTTKATDYTWMPEQRINNMKEGFSFIKMDENGFNNYNVDDNNIDILLMGSSHMEAYQVKQNENCGYLLNQMMPEYKTYNIGVSGHTIYRITDNIDSALKEYKPAKYVIIETNTIQLDINKMKDVLSGEATAIESYDSGRLYYLQKIPAFKPLYNQLDNWVNIKPSSNSKGSSGETIIEDEYCSVLSNFLGLIKAEADKHNITPIIFYAPNEYLSENGELFFQTDDKYFDIYKETCENLGIVFVDMTESFDYLYHNEKLLAHGFSNTAVGVGHLNEHGHKVVAKALVKEINKTEGR